MDKKVLLVTGGSSGIGFAIVEKFLSTGEWVVISVSRNREKINQAVSKLEEYVDHIFFQGDIFNRDNLKAVYKEINDKYGRLDGLVNCAGIIFPGGVEDLSIANWKKSIDINLTGAYIATQRLLPLLKKSSYPSIVNISSISSMLGGSSIAYSVSKAGLDMLTKELAKELAKYKIRVNSVNPGLVNSGFQVANSMMEQEEYDRYIAEAHQSYPLGVGQSEDVANSVYFLMSPEAKWITGSIMIVDGGKSINPRQN